VSAGLPGLGLGGLFFILSALLGPFVELIRTARGRSSIAAWRSVGRQFAMALAIITAMLLTVLASLSLSGAASGDGAGGGANSGAVTILPLTMIGITLVLLVCVLTAAKAMQLLAPARARLAATLGAVRLRRRALASAGAVGASALALLAAFSEPVSQPPGDARGGAGSGDGVLDRPSVAAIEPAETLRAERAPATGPDVASRQITSDSARPGARAQPPEPARDGAGGGQGAPSPGVGEIRPGDHQASPPTTVTPEPPPSEQSAPGRPAEPGPPADSGPPEGAGRPDHAAAPADSETPPGAARGPASV
jgi:hypothetical protein